MTQIIITSLFNKTLKIQSKLPNLLKELQAHYVDWMHACGGKGRCTTCKAIILDGHIGISELTESEKKYRDRNLLKENERLICQITTKSDLKIAIPHKNRFPHIEYSD